MTPWEAHKQRERDRAIRLRVIREVNRRLAIQKLNMAYHDILKTRTFTRMDKDGNVTVRMSFVAPVPANFVVIRLNPFEL